MSARTQHHLIGLIAVFAALLAACGGSTESAADAADDEPTTSATEASTTTTTAATTTTEQTTTTTTVVESLPAADLSSLALPEDIFGEGVAAVQVNVGTAEDEHPISPCGIAEDYEYRQRLASTYVYDGEQFGWPTDSLLVAVAIITAHQAGDADSNLLVSAVTERATSCDPTFPWPEASSDVLGKPVEVPSVRNVDGVGFTAAGSDGTVWQQYALGTEDLGMTLLFIGYGEPAALAEGAAPIVETAQRNLADCLADEACRDLRKAN